MKTTAQKKAELELKLARLKEKERAEETRKKILVGAFLLKKHPDPLKIQGFAESLTRDTDRAIFGLPPLPKKQSDEKKEE